MQLTNETTGESVESVTGCAKTMLLIGSLMKKLPQNSFRTRMETLVFTVLEQMKLITIL